LCLHLPKVRIKGVENVIYKRDNQMGFTDVAVSQDRVYAIHSGNTYSKMNKNFTSCEELLEFDWEGNLLNIFVLKVPATSIYYDEDEHVLYAVRNKMDIPFLKIKLPS